MKSARHFLEKLFQSVVTANTQLLPSPLQKIVAVPAIPVLIAPVIASVLVGSVVVSSAVSLAQTVTATSVERLNGDLSFVHPSVQTPPGAAALLSPVSCLGGLGPLGAYGPLATLGPLGSENSYAPRDVFAELGDWQKLAAFFSSNGGPLSDAGPLGPQGPLGKAYWTTLPDISDFAKQLQAGGLWTVLGPIGPLGVLGPLGPLGPMGGHGFAVTTDGDYVDKDGQVQRQVALTATANAPSAANTDRKQKKFSLVEVYPLARALAPRVNDTSFVSLGKLDSSAQSDRYLAESDSDQFVTVVVVPEKQLDVFSIEIKGRGKVITSNSVGLINWIQLPVKNGERLTLVVKLTQSFHFLQHTYRLIVIGSGHEINSTDIRGPHQI